MHFRSFSALFYLFIICIVFSLMAMPVKASLLVARDADNQNVTLNQPGRLSLVMYTSPDLEDISRKITLALDAYRGRQDFHFVRVVDLRGGLPGAARLIVQAQIDSELDKENKRLSPIYQKNGITPVTRTLAPIIPDYNGNTLQELGWKATSEKVQVVIYDKAGQEIERMGDVTPTTVTASVGKWL